jgi:PPK2 family polyphosphate:nucleotide phosphotransferase
VSLDRAVIDELRVRPGSPAALNRRSTESTTVNWLGNSGKSRKSAAGRELRASVDELRTAQELLWASDTYALLVVLQAMDAAGKDGTIKHVMSGINPQGCQVVAFKPPSAEEASHDFLWRASKSLPARGRIGIFNRSHYEDVLVVRVHPELLSGAEVAPGKAPSERFWSDRYEDINSFEHHLHRSGTRIVKLFLHVSKEEQQKRFLKRLDDPRKLWKFSPADVAERAHWDEYQAAYEKALSATSTPWAPWYVVPADHKYALRALVGGVVVDAIDHLDLSYPEVDPTQADARAQARAQLLSE